MKLDGVRMMWLISLLGLIYTCTVTCTLFGTGTAVILYLDAQIKNRTFTIDYKNDTFLKDGKPFRYIAGSMHYFRTHPFYWRDRLTKMKAAGLNAVQTYVPWNMHEPLPGNYEWTGLADIDTFLQTAQDVGLSVIFRPGPYICAEWEFGGFPAWLLTKNPDMGLRSSDPSYIEEVDKWFNVLLSRIRPHLYENGGPIIMVQIENEYGSYFACDDDYYGFLYNKTRAILGNSVVIFTTDGAADKYLKCGHLDGPYTTVDFGPWDLSDPPAKLFDIQRKYEPRGPAVNSEFYSGWLDHWGETHSTVDTKNLTDGLDMLLEYGANVVLYMFEGGTNFGYWNGANDLPYAPVPTSYDYDAPLNETGDITEKYLAVREVISKHNPAPSTAVPANTPKYKYGNAKMKFITTVQGSLTVTSPAGPIKSQFPLTMEQIQFYYGFVLYRHVLTADIDESAPLVTNGTRDRGYVMVDEVPMGMFHRDFVWEVGISGKAGQYLDILVENTGRVGYGNLMNHSLKGLTENLTLNGDIVEDWEIYPITLENFNSTFASTSKNRSGPKRSEKGDLQTPSIYIGQIPIPDIPNMPQDTYLDMRPWYKGQALVNGFNLGRYWPVTGPQVTLFIPKPVLVAPPGQSTLVVFELESTGCPSAKDCDVAFTDQPLINKIVKETVTTEKPKDSNGVASIGTGINWQNHSALYVLVLVLSSFCSNI